MNNNNIGPNWQKEESRKEFREEYNETFKRIRNIINKDRKIHYQGSAQKASLCSDEGKSSWDVQSEEVINALDCGCCLPNDSKINLKTINYNGYELIFCEKCWAFSICSVCGGFTGINPNQRFWIEKRVYCKFCAEETLKKILKLFKKNPGVLNSEQYSRYKTMLEYLKSQRSSLWRILYKISFKEIQPIDAQQRYLSSR